MSITASQIVANVVTRGATEAKAQLLEVGAASDSAGGRLAGLALGGVVIASAALIGIGAVAAKMAGDFGRSMARLVTGAGDVTDNMAKMGQSILGISTDTGVGTKPLVDAMYQILSSGQRGAQALDTLSVAAKGAQIEQANVADVANVLSGVMTNYGTKVFTATDYMNGLVKAVSGGKITLQDLAVAMGPIDPKAHAMGVSFSDLAAAMSTQTNAMIPAAIAATGLRFLMQSLEVPTTKASKAMKAMGLDTVAVANEMKVSLPGTLQMIYDAAKKAGPEGSVPFVRAISDMIGGNRALTAFMGLTGEHMKDFTKNAAAIAASMRAGSNGVLGWADVQKGFNIQMEKAKAALDAMMISLGQKLLPLLTPLLAGIVPIITGFSTWMTSSNGLDAVLKGISNTIGPVIKHFADYAEKNGLAQKAMALFSTAGKAVSDIAKTLYENVAPLLRQALDWAEKNHVLEKSMAFLQVAIPIIADAIKKAIPVVVEIIKNVVGFALAVSDRLGPIIDKFVRDWKKYWPEISTAFSNAWDLIKGTVQIAWAIVSGVIKIGLDILSGNWKRAWDDLKDMLKGIWDGIVTIFHKAWDTTVADFKKAWDNLSKAASDVGGKIMDALVKPFNDAKNTISGVIDTVRGWISGIATNVSNAVSNASSSLSNAPVQQSIPRFAGGTMFAPGGEAWVGEHGPERVLLPRGSAVLPNGWSAGVAGAQGGGRPIIVNVTVAAPTMTVDGYRLAGALMPGIVAQIRHSTGIVM